MANTFTPVSQIAPSAMGAKAMLTKQDGADAGPFVLGYVRGKANGLSFRNNPQDDTKASIALIGIFEFQPVEGDPLRSTRIYLPGAVHDLIVKALQGDNKAPVQGGIKRGEAKDILVEGEIPVLCEITVRRTNSPIGYEYLSRIAGEMATIDPLADMADDFAKLTKLPPATIEPKLIAAPDKKTPAKKKGGKK